MFKPRANSEDAPWRVNLDHVRPKTNQTPKRCFCYFCYGFVKKSADGCRCVNSNNFYQKSPNIIKNTQLRYMFQHINVGLQQTANLLTYPSAELDFFTNLSIQSSNPSYPTQSEIRSASKSPASRPPSLEDSKTRRSELVRFLYLGIRLGHHELPRNRVRTSPRKTTKIKERKHVKQMIDILQNSMKLIERH